MEKLLSKEFYENLEKIVIPRLENESNKLIIKKIDWEKEANKCLASLTSFFDKVDFERLKNNGINKIGVIDICWNEYGSDIEVDFMPNNDFETAFNDGCIMNDSAIDNNEFFVTYFNVDGEKSWDEIGDDYLEIILAFYYLIKEISRFVAKQEEFKRLPRKSPCYFGFAAFHDEKRTKILTVE